MRPPQNSPALVPPLDPHPGARRALLASSALRGRVRRARPPQGQARLAAIRAHIARLLSGPMPVALIALQGLLTIAFTGAAARGYTHPLLLTIVLAENVGALLLRRLHPVRALTAVSLTYAIVDYLPTTLPALLLALFTVLVLDDGRRSRLALIIAAVVLVAAPALHGDLAGIG